jgi:hypothetical protein
VLRAGMIAALLPLLWRQQDIVDALRGTGAKAIVTAHAPAIMRQRKWQCRRRLSCFQSTIYAASGASCPIA